MEPYTTYVMNEALKCVPILLALPSSGWLQTVEANASCLKMVTELSDANLTKLTEALKKNKK